MVLDGAVDPANNWYRRAIGQGAAFQKSVEDYAQQCAKVVGADCPGSTPDEIRTLVDDLYATAADEPLPVADRDERLGVTELYSAITDAMYAPETQWQDLSAGLWDAADGDGTKLAELAQGEERARRRVRRIRPGRAQARPPHRGPREGQQRCGHDGRQLPRHTPPPGPEGVLGRSRPGLREGRGVRHIQHRGRARLP